MLRKVSRKLMICASVFALQLAIQSVSQACFFFVHQPNIPAGLKKYEK